MRLFEFINLLEYKRDITINRLGDKLVSAAMSDRKQNIDVIISTLENIDPTKNKQYVEWLCRQYINKQFRLEDASRVNEVLVNFENLKRRLPQKDINKYTFYSLSDLIDKEMNVVLDNTDNADAPVDGIKVLYDGPLGMLAIPETEEASKFLGRGTKWCTAADKNNAFAEYSRPSEPLYIWRDKNGKKYQFHFTSFQFMDDKDRPIDHELLMQFRSKHPVLSKLFKKEEENIIDEPGAASLYAMEVLHARWPEAEPYIMKDPEAAIIYAKDFIKGRWPEAEPYILSDPLSDPYFNSWYARDVIKGRWPEAEPYIMKDPYAASMYASDVIKGRWPEAEPYIRTNPRFWQIYQQSISR